MSKERKGKTKKAGAGGEGARSAAKLAPWKRAALVISILATIAGGAGFAYAVITDDTTTSTGGEMDPALARGLLPGADPVEGGDAESVTSLREWSPVVFRLGFSFVVGFCIAYALRSVLKIIIVLVGLVLLAIIGLQSAGMIDVDWSSMEGRWDAITGWLSSQTESLQGFLTGYLPSSASGLAGLVVGFRRK